MKYYIGLDGGGTKTKCILTDENLSVLSESTGDASNFLIKGAEIVSGTILGLLKDVTNSAGMQISDVESVVLGTTGAGRRSNAETMESAFTDLLEQENIELKNFIVDSDARIALEGAFSGKPGSILIAGTGSIMFGKDKFGTIHRVGGFGRFIGDEGSGFYLGRLGLTAAAKQMDGRGGKTILTEMLAEKFDINDSAKLITEVYTNSFDIASVAPLVIAAAEMGDKICAGIIESQSNELADHIGAMMTLLQEDVLKLSLIGGTITTDNHYAKVFREKVTGRFSNLVIAEPELPPALGAVVMARDHSG